MYSKYILCMCDWCRIGMTDAACVCIDASNQAAQEAWTAALNNSDLFKTGEGPSKRVAVQGIPTIEGVRQKAFLREVGHESDLGNQQLLDSALGRLDFVAQGVDIGHDFGGMGVAFRAGAAAGSSSVMGSLMDAPTTPSVTPAQISAMALQNPRAASPATPKPIGDMISQDDMAPIGSMSPRAKRIGVLCSIFP